MSDEANQRDIIDEFIRKIDDTKNGWKSLSIWKKIELNISTLFMLNFNPKPKPYNCKKNYIHKASTICYCFISIIGGDSL